jgi:hypothetical protein
VRRFFGFFFLALVGGVAVLVVLLTPPARRSAVAAAFEPTGATARGAFHVHSARSDGTGTRDEIAVAAAASGLQFVILTDHGDGTRPPEPPTYRSGVLCIDGVEISTDEGHYAVVGLDTAPFPLAGHARDVVEDVTRLGGFGFAAHPGSPKPALQWRDWQAPVDGIEWLNADSEWRDELWGSLGRVLFAYPVRPVETLASLLDRPTAVLKQWSTATTKRRVPVIAAADAHARLGFGQAADPYEDRVVARVPSYQVSFEAFVNHVVLDAPLSGDATRDAAAIVSAIREGRLFSSIDGHARFSAFEGRAWTSTAGARIGEYLDLTGPATLEARIAAPPGTTLAVLHDGTVLYETQSDSLKLEVGSEPGAYHFEAHLPQRDRRSGVPWLLTNPIYIGLRESHRQAAMPSQLAPATDRAPLVTVTWRAEASPDSQSALHVGQLSDETPALEWRFTVAAGARRNQYAAIRFPVESGRLAQFDRLQLRAVTDRPRRVWAQLRSDQHGLRWGRTVYLDSSLRGLDLPFAEFRSMGAGQTGPLPLNQIDSVLLVVDTLNSHPGAAGAIWMPDLWLAR